MALTTPHIAKIRVGLTYARNYTWNPEGTGSLAGKVLVFRLKSAKLSGTNRDDFVIRSDADAEAIEDANGSTLIITDAAQREFALTITDEETATFEPIEGIRWSLVMENADGSKTPMYDGKARIVEING